MGPQELLILLLILVLIGIFFAGYWCGRDVESSKRTQLLDAEYGRWLNHGILHRWISEPFCATHEGYPMREWEEEDYEEGGDPCMLSVRVWMDGYDDDPEPYLLDVPGRPS